MAPVLVLLTEAQVKAVASLPPFNGNLIVEQDGEEVKVTYAADGLIEMKIIAPDGAVTDDD